MHGLLLILLRGTIIDSTCGTDKNLPGIYLPLFTYNIGPIYYGPPKHGINQGVSRTAVILVHIGSQKQEKKKSP